MIVIGLQHKEVSEKLQLTADLELAKAIEIARQSELIKSQINDQGHVSNHDLAVNAVGHKSDFNKFQGGASDNGKSQGYNKGQYKTQKFKPSYTGVKQPD